MYTRKLFVVLILSVSALLLFFAVTVGAQPVPVDDQPLETNDVLPVLQGRVYEGPVGVETVPLSGVQMALYGTNDPYPSPATLISVTYTDASGWYGFPAVGNYEFYRIREFDPPSKVSVGATTVGGTVESNNVIQYVVPLAGKVWTGNKFWDQPQSLIWDKWINDEVWHPDIAVTSETSDTIEVVDVIAGWSNDDLTLAESWNPNRLRLLDWTVQPFSGAEVSNPGSLDIILPEGNRVYTITKIFHVEPSTWTATTLVERVFLGDEQLATKSFRVNKTPPQLWINGDNRPNVYAGDVVSFTLAYGNSGGYENNVMIRNTFPITAPYVNANPPPDRLDQNGTWVEWDVGDLARDSIGEIEVLIAIDETLPPSTTIIVQDWIFNHVGDEVGITEMIYHVEPRPPELVWDKWVNGIFYDPDLVITAETSDTIEIVDIILTPVIDPVILEERWDPAQLQLSELIIEPDPGTAITEPGRMEVLLPEGSNVFTVTKLFHVEVCTWQVTFIEELLHKVGEQPWVRTVPIEKIQPELWIDSFFDVSVVVGEPAEFELQYGNGGGRETYAYIRNEFPEIARFIDSVPPPIRVDPNGFWAEWDLPIGPLNSGTPGSILVSVGIAPELPPSTTITIWDGIFNHAGDMVDEVFTEYHVPHPPVTWPEGDWPWYAQEEITVWPEPPVVDQPTEICAEIVNNDVVNDHPVLLEFSVSKLGIGLPFDSVGAVEVLVPAAGANRGCIVWVPPTPDHWCIQARILGERYPFQISRRNVDVDEPLTPGVEHSRRILIGNPYEEPVTITLELIPHLQEWGLDISPHTFPAICPICTDTFTITVEPPVGIPLPPDGMPIVDIEAFVGDTLIGGIRKIYRPPVPLHRFPDPPYAEREITVHPYPPRAGEPTEICVDLANPTPYPQNVSVMFFWANFGIGLPFTPINGSRPVHLPPHSKVRECIHWVPPVGGQVCLQVKVDMEGHLPQISQRNIDINEILQPGIDNTMVFNVGNPTASPVTVTLGLKPHLPGWGLALDPDELLNIPPGSTRLVSLTVTPPQDEDLPQDGEPIVDIEGYVEGELLGGFRKLYRPPVPIHRPRDPVYAESEIGVDPYPVLPGQPVRLSVEVHNPTPVDQIVTATFAVADFGIGLPFSTNYIAPNPILIFVPAHGAAQAHTFWTPPNHWGKFCVQVTLEVPGHEPFWSRRNIDVGEPLRPEIPHSLDFQVGSWPHTGPVTIELGLVKHKPGWDISLSDSVLIGVDQSQPFTVTLTVTAPVEAKLGTGLPIVDVEAYVGDILLGGFRKLDIPPIPLHKPHERTYAESEISIIPYPPKLGFKSKVSTVVQNVTPHTTTVNLEFGWAQFGIGIPFTSTGMVPAIRTVELGPLMAMTSTVMWTPEMAGHQCVLVKLNDAAGVYEEQWSQRNVEVERTPPCGVTKIFTFTVYNDSPFTTTIDVGMITFNVPADWQVTVNPTGTVDISAFTSLEIEINVHIPCPMSMNVIKAQQDIKAIQANSGSVPTIDVEAYKDEELLGGIEIRFDDTFIPDFSSLFLPIVTRNP